MSHPLIISLSPRPGGNSDTAATCFAMALPCSGHTLHLRDHNVLPCEGCGACATSGLCVQAGQDDTEALFAALDQASSLILTAPVYFYHLPSQAKAWIDRSQSRYLLRQTQSTPRRPPRPACAVLVAGRPRGEHLFTGILRTLRYFLDIFDYTLTETLCLRGLDDRRALSAEPAALTAITALAQGRTW